MWLILILASAFFLGVYDVSKKMAVRDNAVLPALLMAMVASLALMLPAIVLSAALPQFMQESGFYVATLSWHGHFLLFLKSLIVASSWMFSYFAIKHLPVSIVSPIRAISPVITLIAAMIIFGEQPSTEQFAGMAVMFGSFYYFSTVGKLEGIKFHKNKWVIFVFIATLLGSASSLYDKHLLAKERFNPITLQAWFTVYLVVILLGVVMIFWYPRRKETTRFQWRWSIVAVGVLLILADFLYFKALTFDGAMVSILSMVRRSSVVVSFSLGAIIFKELNTFKKTIALCGVLIGLFLILRF